MINTTNDRTLCCSDTCEKRYKCDRSHINHIGTYYVEDYFSFGTGTYTDNGCEIEHWCGKKGNYKMFEPIEEIEPEEKILFPFQFLEKYFLGEMTWDAAIDSTLEEAYRLIEEYAEKHDIKT